MRIIMKCEDCKALVEDPPYERIVRSQMDVFTGGNEERGFIEWACPVCRWRNSKVVSNLIGLSKVSSVDLDPEISKLVDDNFSDLTS